VRSRQPSPPPPDFGTVASGADLPTDVIVATGAFGSPTVVVSTTAGADEVRAGFTAVNVSVFLQSGKAEQNGPEKSVHAYVDGRLHLE
jgi:hypothetical protein